MKILFVTDRNLTHDTRVFQQLFYAKNMLYFSDLVAFYDPWCQHIEQQHVKLVNPIHYYYLKRNSLYSFVVQKFSSLLQKIFPRNLYFTGMSMDTRSFQIWRKIKKIARGYDLIVACGLASLLPVYLAARRYSKPFGYDSASFVAEKHINLSEIEFHKIKFLLKNILPNALYLTYSTQMVGEKLLKFLSLTSIPYNFSLASSYDESLFVFRPSLSQKVEFVWLSQKVDYSVDLELILPSLEKFKDQIRLNIFGEVTERFAENILPRYRDFVVLHDPMPVDKLIRQIANYDIGLAIYLAYISPEKNYTLTNKVYLFAQAGLFALATDTISHRIFYSEHTNLGKIVLPHIDSLIEAIADVIDDIENLRQQKHKRYLYSKRFAWKYESQKLYTAWSQVKKRK